MIKIFESHVIIEKTEEKNEEETTTSGIIIPKTAGKQKQLIVGKVLAVGVEVRNVTVGDKVYVNVMSTQPIFFNGIEGILTNEDSIFAVETD